jgi:GNAT superfamily N-acetyltransferase
VTTTVRDATPDDAAALVRIRQVMLASFQPGPDDGAWIPEATEEPYRRRGLAREVVTHLVQRLDADAVPRIDLTASEEGMGLYLSLGFAPSDAPLLRRRRTP